MNCARLLPRGLAAGPAAVLLFAYRYLPERVPVHWGLDGTVSYGGRGALWLAALLPPAVLLLLELLPRLDPRRDNYRRFQRDYAGFAGALMVFFLALNAVVLTETLRPGALSVGRAATLALGILWAFLGNLLPRVKSNFFFGIKTPWTLSDPDVWNRTHRLGGALFFSLGLLLIPSALFLPQKGCMAVLLGGGLTAAGLPALQSYRWYREISRSREGKP